MSRKPTYNPAQESMFAPSGMTGIEHPKLSIVEPLDVQPESPPEGSSVNIMDRNRYLGEAVKRLGLISRTDGLKKMSETPEGREELETRYVDVDAALRSFTEHQNWRMADARKLFTKAYGGNEKEGRDVFRKEFIPRFADSKNRSSREAYKKQLAKQRRVFTRKTS